MSQKKISIATKPRLTEEEVVNNFVAGKPLDAYAHTEQTSQAVSRLTVVIPKSLHKKLKQKAFEEDKKIYDLVTEILDNSL